MTLVMKKLYIMCGLAFSGKSTLAKKIAEEKRALLVSQDQFWFEREEEMNLDLDSDDDWEKILRLSRAEVRRLLAEENSVVYDDISLKYSDRELLRNLANEYGAEAILVYLDTPREIQLERRRKNLETKKRHDIPDHILEWGDGQLEIPQETERPVVFRPDSDVASWLKELP
jgi:predicted kinase